MAAPTATDFAEKDPHARVISDGPIEGVATMNDDVVRRMSVIPGIAETTDAALDGTAAEKRMGIMQGFRLYPKAVGWSILLSTAIVMEGYDVVLLGNFYGFPQFGQKYGQFQDAKGQWQLTAAWQAGLSNGANVGEILGLFVNGIVSEKIGYRWTMIGSLCMVICFIFISFFAPNVQTLLAAEILCGIPWGVFQTLTTAYAAEVMPVPLRCYLTTYVNLCWVMGQFIASGVIRALVYRTDQWAYRIPFAVQWIWPVPIIIGCLFAPESPWWLIRKERKEDAKKALLRLTSPKRDPTFSADDTIAMMVHTNELEKQITSGVSYKDCFKGIDLRRTEITCGVWAIQNLCGSAFMGFSAYFYEQAGNLDTEHTFDLTLSQYALGAVGTIGSWFMMSRFGRRSLYLWGLIVLDILVLVIGILGVPPTTTNLSWAIGSMLLIYTFVYDFTVGPVCYSLVAEMSSTRLRTKTIVLARNFYNFWGIINNIWTPYMLNPDAWNWQAKTGFFWAGWCFLCLVWTYFRLPEPKGRTYGEMDILFENKISARKFKYTDATQFHGETLRIPSVSESFGKEGGPSFDNYEIRHKETEV